MQISFTDMEYTNRRHKSKRELFLEKMDKAIPWAEWEELVRPHYPSGRRGRKPQSIRRMLKMFMLRTWYGLSDRMTEEEVYDRYSMKRFMELDYSENEQVPDSTTLCKFRKILKEAGLDEVFIEQARQLMK